MKSLFAVAALAIALSIGASDSVPAIAATQASNSAVQSAVRDARDQVYRRLVAERRQAEELFCRGQNTRPA